MTLEKNEDDCIMFHRLVLVEKQSNRNKIVHKMQNNRSTN